MSAILVPTGLLTGVAEMDGQHDRLFHEIQQVKDALLAAEDAEGDGFALLSRLADELDQHFMWEEESARATWHSVRRPRAGPCADRRLRPGQDQRAQSRRMQYSRAHGFHGPLFRNPCGSPRPETRAGFAGCAVGRVGRLAACLLVPNASNPPASTGRRWRCRRRLPAAAPIRSPSTCWPNIWIPVPTSAIFAACS